MTDTEIAIKITALEHEAKSAKHRLLGLETQNAAIQELALSVRELTLNMTRMAEAQDKQRADIEKLKNEPIESLKSAKKTAIASMITTTVGAIVGALLLLIAQYIGG